ncbi:MAG TPA: hypothetical protein VFB43_16970 [Terracidiphilus sp.]|nr:hypothetical protein [Terracidiphilus sp.]
MSYDEWDAMQDAAYDQLYEEIGPEWARDHAQELFEENYDEAVQHFTKACLKSYYLAHPQLATPAVSAVEYAKALLPSFETAALVFAATSVELTWKSAVLKPLVAGVIHIESLTEEIVDRTIPKTGGLERLGSFLSRVLKETASIDFSTYKRPESTDLLRIEINRITLSRNEALHGGKGCEPGMAQLAIDVADHMLLSFLPRLINAIGLMIDGMCLIHAGV